MSSEVSSTDCSHRHMGQKGEKLRFQQNVLPLNCEAALPHQPAHPSHCGDLENLGMIFVVVFQKMFSDAAQKTSYITQKQQSDLICQKKSQNKPADRTSSDTTPGRDDLKLILPQENNQEPRLPGSISWAW